MVELVCGKEISKITNVNTDTRVNDSRMSLIFHGYKRALERRLKKKRESIAADESWPNWYYYVENSKKIESLWMRPNNVARELFAEILGKDPYLTSIRKHSRTHIKLFLRLLTLKIWFDQRVGGT